VSRPTTSPSRPHLRLRPAAPRQRFDFSFVPSNYEFSLEAAISDPILSFLPAPNISADFTWQWPPRIDAFAAGMAECSEKCDYDLRHMCLRYVALYLPSLVQSSGLCIYHVLVPNSPSQASARKISLMPYA
jgi:hypothetical protein